MLFRSRRLRHPWTSLPNLLLEKSALPEWTGTSGDFLRNPPDAEAFPALSDADFAAILEKIGPARGVEAGVSACLGLLHPA